MQGSPEHLARNIVKAREDNDPDQESECMLRLEQTGLRSSEIRRLLEGESMEEILAPIR